MAKDSLQSTWKKTLSGVITAIGVDNNGTVWAGDGAGKLSRFTSNGIASDPIYLDNPICSIAIDKTSNNIYVGDLANNVYKYTASGKREWAKNLGTGSVDAISIVSTINGNKPDVNGDFDLKNIYYSQNQIDAMLAPLGKTKSVNGNTPDDAGNIKVDLSGYYAYKGALNDGSDLNNKLDTGWYALHKSDGSTSILLSYSDKNVSGLQVLISTDKSISVRYIEDNKYTEWAVLTNNVESINNIKPDKNGNVNLDLTGNIKTVNRIKPDKDGNIQLGVGSVNSVKSVNNSYYPDKTGNVQVPAFSLNLLSNTSDKPTVVKPDTNNQSVNYWDKEDTKINRGFTDDLRNPLSDHGRQLTAETPVSPSADYVASFSVWTMTNTIDLGSPLNTHYTMWRNPKVTFFIICKDANGNEIAGGVYKYKYHFKQQDTPYQGYVNLSFSTPPTTATVSLWYNGFERSDDNLIKHDTGVPSSFGFLQNAVDQTVELDNMNLVKNLTGKEISLRVQAYVTNYKKGSFFTLKTKGMDATSFKLDSSNLDSNKKLIKAISDIDENNLITGNGFYSWDYVMSADDLAGIDNNTVTPITDVVGNVEYTFKIVDNTNNSSPDMEWVAGVSSNGTYSLYSYNGLKFFNLQLYNKDTCNIIDLGTYKFSESKTGVDSTAGKYSASVFLDMGDSTGFCRLVLQKYDTTTNNVISEVVSKKLPVIDLDDEGAIELVQRSTCYLNSIDNKKPKETEAIRLRAYIYGQTANVYISKAKLAKWLDDDTPPDLNWLPNVEDVLGGVRTVQGKEPDKDGNVNLSSEFVSPSAIADFVPKNKLSDLYALTKAGTKKKLSGMVDFNSITDNGVYRLDTCYFASDIKPIGVSLLNFNGWLFVLDYDETSSSSSRNVYQLIIADSDEKHYDAGVYFRKLNNSAATKARFNIIALDSDIAALSDKVTSLSNSVGAVNSTLTNVSKNLNSVTAVVNKLDSKNPILSINDNTPNADGAFTLHDFEHPTKSFGKKEVVDVDNMKTAGVYSLSDSAVKATINTSALDGLPRTTDGTTMAGYLVVLYHDGWNIEQILILNTGLYTPDVVVATRSIAGLSNFRPAFRRLLNSDDYYTIYNSINSVQSQLDNVQKTWRGTLEQYKSLSKIDPTTMYYILSDYEVVIK